MTYAIAIVNKNLMNRTASFENVLVLLIDRIMILFPQCFIFLCCSQKYILEHGEPEKTSGKQERLELMLNHYV